MFIAGVVAMKKEIVHAAISTAPIQAGPILLVVAGILSLVVACIGIYFVWKKMTLDGNGKALLIVVSLLCVVFTVNPTSLLPRPLFLAPA